MGKIHDALQRAEALRLRAGGRPGGPSTAREVVDRLEIPRAGKRWRDRGRHLKEARRSRIVMSEAESVVTEQFRSLRARLQSIRRTRPVRSIVISSALPREGKTTTAVNLALSFGLDLERQTCLVDCDLRTPRVHHALPQPPEAGLAEVLEGDAKLEEGLVMVPDTRLSVLAVRSLPTHPSELLSSRRMLQLLEELHSRFDTVLLDSPPIVGLPDTTTLLDLCDAAVLVVGAGRSSREEVESALERIDASKVLGLIFNRCDTVPKPYGQGYGEGAS